MFKKIVFAVSFCLLSLFGYAQNNINDYKYIIIPKAFEFSKSDDQYQLNSMLEFFFNKYGYEAYFVDELSSDLKKDPCLALTAGVSNDKGGMFKTKLEIILKDCYDVEIMRSKIGESRLKDFDKAYSQALREAFETFQNMDYKFVGKEKVVAQPEAIQPKIAKQPVKEIVKIEEVAVIKETKEQPKEKVTALPVKAKENTKPELYYAQAISNGFQLVNSEPKVIMILLNSSAKDIFIVKDKNAIVFKKDDQWIYSENTGTSATENILNIKF
ncbi:hypothetical protein [Winogradskyella psychrotolerans]|uniref:hypothetical protein n=1 Tax=Winogradskyella psychrotolerans TaxID=1344585 RepID=UPI001C07183B|nr:hypothetical protein [Winogradskyella psychrotolerans]MBU2928737.1 hypothetical protein [Winogradskyella psychrotolerans]